MASTAALGSRRRLAGPLAVASTSRGPAATLTHRRCQRSRVASAYADEVHVLKDLLRTPKPDPGLVLAALRKTLRQDGLSVELVQDVIASTATVQDMHSIQGLVEVFRGLTPQSDRNSRTQALQQTGLEGLHRAIINVHCKANRLDQGRQALMKMAQDGIKPTREDYIMVLRCCVELGGPRAAQAEELLKEMRTMGLLDTKGGEPGLPWSLLLEGYGNMASHEWALAQMGGLQGVVAKAEGAWAGLVNALGTVGSSPSQQDWLTRAVVMARLARVPPPAAPPDSTSGQSAAAKIQAGLRNWVQTGRWAAGGRAAAGPLLEGHVSERALTEAVDAFGHALRCAPSAWAGDTPGAEGAVTGLAEVLKAAARCNQLGVAEALLKQSQTLWLGNLTSLYRGLLPRRPCGAGLTAETLADARTAYAHRVLRLLEAIEAQLKAAGSHTSNSEDGGSAWAALAELLMCVCDALPPGDQGWGVAQRLAGGAVEALRSSGGRAAEAGAPLIKLFCCLGTGEALDSAVAVALACKLLHDTPSAPSRTDTPALRALGRAVFHSGTEAQRNRLCALAPGLAPLRQQADAAREAARLLDQTTLAAALGEAMLRPAAGVARPGGEGLHAWGTVAVEAPAPRRPRRVKRFVRDPAAAEERNAHRTSYRSAPMSALACAAKWRATRARLAAAEVAWREACAHGEGETPPEELEAPPPVDEDMLSVVTTAATEKEIIAEDVAAEGFVPAHVLGAGVQGVLLAAEGGHLWWSLEAFRSLRRRRPELRVPFGAYEGMLRGMSGGCAFSELGARGRVAVRDPGPILYWLLHDMVSQGHYADTALYNLGLQAFGRAVTEAVDQSQRPKVVKEAFALLQRAVDGTLPGHVRAQPDTASYNALIKMCIESGMTGQAVAILETLEKHATIRPDAATYCSVIAHVAGRTGEDVQAGEDLFTRMVNNNVAPTPEAVDLLLWGHLRQREVAEAVSFVQHVYNQHGVAPTAAMFLNVVDVALALGDQPEASRAVAVARQVWQDHPEQISSHLRDVSRVCIERGTTLDALESSSHAVQERHTQQSSVLGTPRKLAASAWSQLTEQRRDLSGLTPSLG